MKRGVSLMVAVVLGFAVAGCGAKKKLPAGDYHKEGTAEFDDGSYELAIQQYHDLIDHYPFDEHSEEAEVRIAQSHFLNKDYPEAVAALTDFQRRHPTSSYLPLVGYTLGLCYVRQMEPPDRDQTASQNAYSYLVTVARQFPNSPYASLAEEELDRCRDSLAEHQLIIADFYRIYYNDLAAESRLLTLLAQYGESQVGEPALIELSRLYRGQQNAERAALADAALVARYPKSTRANSAQRRLDDGGEALVANRGDPMITLLAGVPRISDISTSQPVKVPGLERPEDHRTYPSSPGISPPGQFGGNLPY